MSFHRVAVCTECCLQCTLECAVFLFATPGLGVVGRGLFVGLHPAAFRLLLFVVASLSAPADALSRLGIVRFGT